MTKKIILISPKNRTVYNFRGDLVKTLISKGYEVLVTGPDLTDVDKIEALGARFIEIPMNKTGTSISQDLKYCKALRQLMEREHPDAVLGYTSKPVIYGSLAASAAGVKNINALITGAGYTFTAKTAKAKLLGAVVKTLYKKALKKSDHIIFQNQDDMQEFCQTGLAQKEKCKVVNGSGVNMDHFSPSGIYPYKENGYVTFFMLSRLLKSKGVREYLEAARMVKTEYPETRFLLLGKYEYDMQDAIPQEEIEQYITEGVIQRYEETDDVRPYYNQCDVYVLPSYREGMPRTVLEAMSMGRAIITTDTNGCRDTLAPIKDCRDMLASTNEHIDTFDQTSRCRNTLADGESSESYTNSTKGAADSASLCQQAQERKAEPASIIVLFAKNGCLVPVADAQAVAEAMKAIIADPARIEEMGRSSLSHCTDQFEITKVNQKMLKYMNLE